MDDPLDNAADGETSRGLFASLRSLIDRVLTSLQTRGELLSTELEEEVTRLVGVLVWSFTGVFAAIVGLSFMGVAILLAAPANWRVPVAILLAMAFLAVAVAGWFAIRRISRAKPRPFNASLGEIDRDLQKLRSRR